MALYRLEQASFQEEVRGAKFPHIIGGPLYLEPIPLEPRLCPMANVEHIHIACFFIDDEQNAVMAKDELPKTQAKNFILIGTSATARKTRKAFDDLEEFSDPMLRSYEIVASNEFIDPLNVPQCPWRQAYLVKGTST